MSSGSHIILIRKSKHMHKMYLVEHVFRTQSHEQHLLEVPAEHLLEAAACTFLEHGFQGHFPERVPNVAYQEWVILTEGTH